MAQGALEAQVAQEDQQDQVSHSLGYQVNLEPQVGPEDQALPPLWVPEIHQEEVTDHINQFLVR